ncbi:hypothetical protein PIB30_032388 [Stylosanthes scabra]|uniref:Uncharacterized protein n=1 Tax=Stylosanthes scabra TaxID=79078 RepID=A0ABU6WAM1_9FABA|nr:hypothetical protein [Stylosanthes scabra]
MVGGLAAIQEMRRKMLHDASNPGSREHTSSSTEKDDVVGDENIEVSNPEQTSLASPPRKKQKKGKESVAKDVIFLEANASDSFGCILKQGFKAAKFVDSCLLTNDTKEALLELSTEKELIQMQKMMLRSAALCRDVERKIPKFRSTIEVQDKSLRDASSLIKSLNVAIAALQEENGKLKEG